MELPRGVGVPRRDPTTSGVRVPFLLPLPHQGGLVLEPSGARVARRGLAVAGACGGPPWASFVWRLWVRGPRASRHVGGACGLGGPEGTAASSPPRGRGRRGVGGRLEEPRPVALVTSAPAASRRASVPRAETQRSKQTHKKASRACEPRGAGRGAGAPLSSGAWLGAPKRRPAGPPQPRAQSGSPPNPHSPHSGGFGFIVW